MKIRNGFVSNSSAASFIVDWAVQANSLEAYDEITPALLAYLVASGWKYGYDEKDERMIWIKYNDDDDYHDVKYDGPIYKEDEDFFTSIKERTKIKSINDGKIEARTEFFTSMNNGTYDSFSPMAMKFVMQLIIKGIKYEARVQDED